MSTTQRQISPQRAFERYIWTNAEICSGCFTRVREIDEIEYGTDRHPRPYVDVATTDEGEYGYDVENPPATVVSQTPNHIPRIVCLDCGSVGALADSEVLSKDESLSRVPALHERLAEEGIDSNIEAMYTLVRKAKSNPNVVSKDREIFENAVALGVKYAKRHA